MLNPDGVARGYWRQDTRGVNLNRVYDAPDPVLHPTIYAAKLAVKHEHARNKLVIYTDLHAHVSKRGCFVFGNTFQNPLNQAEQILLPKLISLNCVNFGLPDCGFNDSNNNKKDLRGDSRAGSSRATFSRETGLLYCFTLEGNYTTGQRINTLQSRYNFLSGKKLKTNPPIKDTSSDFYKTRKIPIYTSEVYRDVGASFCTAILDLYEINPVSRICKGGEIGLATAVNAIRDEILRDLTKPTTIKSIKKKSKTFGPTFELVLAPDEETKEDGLLL